MPPFAAKKKRLLEDELISIEASFKKAKQELIGRLDVAKIARSSENAVTKSRADSRYRSLLTTLHSQNISFEEKVFNLKSQIYDIEAAEILVRTTSIPSCHQRWPQSYMRDDAATRMSLRLMLKDPVYSSQYQSQSQSQGLASEQSLNFGSAKLRKREVKTTRNVIPLMKTIRHSPVHNGDHRLRLPQDQVSHGHGGAQQQMQLIEQQLVPNGPTGFSFLPSSPLFVKETAQEGQTRERWIQIYCAACISNVNSSGGFFKGLQGLKSHLKAAACIQIFEQLELDMWAYVLLHCMMEVSEADVMDVTAGKTEIPKFRQGYLLEEIKAEPERRTSDAELRSKNLTYWKLSPHKFAPIIDLDGDFEAPQDVSPGQALIPKDQTAQIETHSQRSLSVPAPLMTVTI